MNQSWGSILAEYWKVLAIYAANAFVDKFPLVSRINHSCPPNIHFSFNSKLGRETFHAIRDITASEELTIMYIDGTNRTRAQR